MLPPIKLSPQQEELCRRLEALNQRTIQSYDLSKMFTGAIYLTREECRSNPDWMAQSAHSLREILYQFQNQKPKTNWMKEFNKFGSVTTEDDRVKGLIKKIYGDITAVAHHTHDLDISEYIKLINEYERVLLWALSRQIDIHKQIDTFLSERKPEKSGR